MLEIFKRNALNDMIGERELRKVLFEYLARPHDHYVTSIIANLRYSMPPDESNFFRRFRLGEVVEVTKKLLTPGVIGYEESDEDELRSDFDDEEYSDTEVQTNMATRNDDMLDSILLGRGGSTTLSSGTPARRSTKRRRSTKGRRSTMRMSLKHASTLEHMNFYVEKAYKKEQDERQESE